jgi:fibronectin-binding autotransporter adhesin
VFNKPIAIDATGGGIFTYQGNKTVDSTVTIASGGTLEASGLPRNNSTTSTLTLTGKITGAGNLVVHREGSSASSRRAMIELTSNDNDYSGTTTIGGGGGITGESAAQDYVTLSIGNGGATGSIGPGDITINPLGSLRFNRVATYTIANTITGGGDVSGDAAGGVVNLTGTNSYSGITTVNAGVLNVNGTHTGGADYTVALGATLGGTGTIGSNVTVNGSIAPGTSIESLDVTGNLLLNGALNIEFNGDTDIIDRLNVGGSFDITTATIAFTNLGTASLNGVPHIIATYGSLIGTAFTSVTGLPGGYAIDYDYLGNQIALVAGAHPGDFDSDGDVDGADFVAWQTNFPTASGATLAQGDADGDGDVDGADFVVWQTNFPFTPGPGASPVPEPHGFVLVGLGGLFALLKLRKRV